MSGISASNAYILSEKNTASYIENFAHPKPATINDSPHKGFGPASMLSLSNPAKKIVDGII